MPKYSEMSPEQREKHRKSTAASVNRYNQAHYVKLTIRLRQDGSDGVTADAIRAAAESAGQSVNSWIISAIRSAL